MNQLSRRSNTSKFGRSPLGWAILAAIVGITGGARSARAADPDPFAETPSVSVDAESPGGGAASKPKVPSGPAAAPAASAGAVVPGIIEQLPASAYPEPFTRGLYGGPLWLDMQGLQWPYMPQTGIGISGYGWVDANARLIRTGNPNIPASYKELLDQGRFVLRITPTYTNGVWFVQTQAEIVANTNQVDLQPTPGIVSADDVWVRTGVLQKWDITVGRFQAFDVYPLGMGLDLNTYERQGAFDPSFLGTPNQAGAVPQIYLADYLFYRPGGPPNGSRVGNAAFHIYPFKFLRGELLGQFGNDGAENYAGARPAAIFDMGILKVRGALEYQYKWAEDPRAQFKSTIKNRGGAASAQVVFAPFIEGGVNFGYAIYDTFDSTNPGGDPALSGDRYSFGGFVDVSPLPAALPYLLIGGGANYATNHNLIKDNEGHFENSTSLQSFLAVQYLFYKQLYFKVVAGYAKSHFENKATTTPYDDDMFSLRIRLQYLF
jgi:hypothetical protein